MKGILSTILVMSLLVAGFMYQSLFENSEADTQLITESFEQTEVSASPVTGDLAMETMAGGREMPSLPDWDFEGMTFKDDGYEIVELISIADGDTANFLVAGNKEAVRFLAIDTPEVSGPSGLEPWALAAKVYTQEALENAEVIIIEKDPESDVYDRYGRLLGWVWVDGDLLNYRLVEEGLAQVKYLYSDYRYNPVMIRLESQVEKTGIRIWGEVDPDYPQ